MEFKSFKKKINFLFSFFFNFNLSNKRKTNENTWNCINYINKKNNNKYMYTINLK